MPKKTQPDEYEKITTTIPRSHRELAEQRAAARGLPSFAAYVVALIRDDAAAAGLTIPPLPPRRSGPRPSARGGGR